MASELEATVWGDELDALEAELVQLLEINISYAHPCLLKSDVLFFLLF